MFYFMAEVTLNLTGNERAKRGEFLVVAEWKSDGSSGTSVREVLGAYAESSSIEFNNDVNTITDVLDIVRTDVNKTEPQQSFDPLYISGNSKLSAYLMNAALNNDINKYNGVFNVYIIMAFAGAKGAFEAKMHEGCTILPVSIGGDGGGYVSMPIEVHYSNNITEGTVDKLADDFKFTPKGESEQSLSF